MALKPGFAPVGRAKIMRQQAVQHWVLGLVIAVTILWLDLVPAETLRRAAFFTLAWAGASTLLVASAGACIALARTRRQ
jgi:hypothetical protein